MAIPALTATAEAIVEISRIAAPSFERAITSKSKTTPAQVIPLVFCELCVLYVCLLSRFFSSSSSIEQRTIGNKKILDEIRRKSPMADLAMNESLFDLYDEVHMIYEKFELPVTGQKLQLSGNPFWEFGKRIGFKYEGYNAIALQAFTITVMDGFINICEILAEIAKLDKADSSSLRSSE